MSEEEEFNYTIEEQTRAFENTAQVRIHTLTQIMKIIDIASNRGAFQAADMSFIGNIYDSLSKGVNAAMQKARKELKQEQVQQQQGQQKIKKTTPIINQQPSQQTMQQPAQQNTQNIRQQQGQKIKKEQPRQRIKQEPIQIKQEPIYQEEYEEDPESQFDEYTEIQLPPLQRKPIEKIPEEHALELDE